MYTNIGRRNTVVIAIVWLTLAVAGCHSTAPAVSNAPSNSAAAAVASTPKSPSSLPSLSFVDGKPSGYRLLWQDDFRGNAGAKPDQNIWHFDTGTGSNGWGNQELETYVDDAAHCHIVADPSASDGYALQIQATKDASGGIQSARINTLRTIAFRYGYLEARVKVPNGKGLWPGFWMMGCDLPTHGWPNCGNITVMNVAGDSPSINHAAISGAGFTTRMESLYSLPSGTFADSYHTFGVKWDARSITYFVDGHPFDSKSPSDTPQNFWPFQKSFFLLLNLAVGGSICGNPDNDTNFPSTYLIDYVRVYQPIDAASTPFHGTHPIPGVVECEDYDAGGQGVAYSCRDGVNVSGKYRPDEDVDIEDAGDSRPGFAIGWTSSGNWLKYTVVAKKSGAYHVAFRVSSGEHGGTLHLEDENGKNLTGAVVVAGTGGWQNWTTVKSTIQLTQGKHVLKLVEDTGGYNLDNMSFS